MEKGLLFVVSAPSGCGKGTILKEILKDPSFYYSVSATTRDPREGEVDGVHYQFLQKEQFEMLIAEGSMLEYAEYCKNYYGTILTPITDNLEQGKNVILEIEVQGALQVMKKRPDAVSIFIMPPSIEELRKRLTSRGTETAEVIEERVAKAVDEIGFADRYDYIVVNDVLEEAISDFRCVIRAEECKEKNNEDFIREVLKNA